MTSGRAAGNQPGGPAVILPEELQGAFREKRAELTTLVIIREMLYNFPCNR